MGPQGDRELSDIATVAYRTPRLAGCVAVVTGGGQGIGQAISLRFASEGADVAIVDVVDAEPACALIAEIARSNDRSAAFSADVTKKPEVERAFSAVLKRFGRIDILVNNVGGGGSPARPLIELDEEHWDGSLASNLKSSFLCTQAFARIAIEQGRPGKVINMSSLSGKMGTPLLGMYAVAKAGVIRLTDVFARELAQHGITVNCVCPGVVETALTEKILARHPDIFVKAFDLTIANGSGVREALERKIPLGRLATPDDVAAVTAFLASSDADYLTGQALNCNGGIITH